MNKYLMMSAAAMVGTVASAAMPAFAGTFEGTVGFWNSSNTLNYCDNIQVYNAPGEPGDLVGRHNFSPCGYFTYYGAGVTLAGEGKGSVGAKTKAQLGDAEFGYLYGVPWEIVYDVGLPIKKKSHWDCYYSTSGTTAYFCNSGFEGTPYPGHGSHLTTTDKLTKSLGLKLQGVKVHS
ncbi:MAG TPA: hypothetical protein VKR31_15630 [Rhizomicrobium sp.]|nr:hypothetical protein [Rhizomicrobium sp.]